MSETESFIEEVTEEVRREKLYGYLKRYGWIAAAAVLALVAGASWNEYQKAQTRAQAEQLGDAMLAAIELEDISARVDALDEISAATPSGAALLGLLAAGQAVEAGEGAEAASRLTAISQNAELPLIYRNIAAFKGLLAGAETLSMDERRAGFDALAVPGNPLRVLAQEQLALLEVESGNTEGAIERLEAITVDADASEGVRGRARDLITALGGTL